MIIGYLSFGRVPGCLDLGALFLCGGGTNGGTNGQSASGVGHRRCAGCGWGEFFWGGVVRGLGIEAVLDRV
mgnify:CR=1 FL=1